jgi:serine/threonine-protein kinase RsbT
MNEVLMAEEGAAAHAGAIVAHGDNGAGIRVVIRSHADVLAARKSGRELARALGFSNLDCILIVAAISELARNILLSAQHGEIRIRPELLMGDSGIEITAGDCGPRIRDLRRAIEDGTSGADNLGLGLPGVKRIMDDFDVVSNPGRGATVTVRKWRSKRTQPRGYTHHPRITGGQTLPRESLDV